MNNKAEGITWISAQSLIQLRLQASQISLDKSKIHAKQGGAYLSTFKGRGMEFDESRIYQAGDDIRNMDWRVTARTGTAHTKVFREERERPVLLMLDLSASMMFATRNKFKAVIAAEIAALIAWSAAKNNDRIGGLIFSSQQHIEIKPRRGKTAVLDFIGRCAKHKAWQASETKSEYGNNTTTDKISALSRLRKVTHPGSLIFMISDFRDMDEKSFSSLADVSRNNDIIIIKISDPFEISLPKAGSYRLTDGLNECQIQTANQKTRNEYHQHYLTHDDKLKTFCRQHRIHLIDISTDDNTITKLKQGLGVSHNSSARSKQHNAQYRDANA
jgi:uncharacterized protein (DUF58 family)